MGFTLCTNVSFSRLLREGETDKRANNLGPIAGVDIDYAAKKFQSSYANNRPVLCIHNLGIEILEIESRAALHEQ